MRERAFWLDSAHSYGGVKMEVVRTTTEQGIGQYAALLQQTLEGQYQANLVTQNSNLCDAMRSLELLRDFVRHPEHILGSDKTKHGEIFEWMQACFGNSRNAIRSLAPDYVINPDRFARDDLFFRGIAIQCKNVNGTKATFSAIMKHFEAYPESLNDGSRFLIPKDRHEEIMGILTKKPSLLSASEHALKMKIREFEKATGFDFTKNVKPGIVRSDQTQLYVAEATVDEEEISIQKTDKEIREKFYRESRPNFGDFAKATLVGAALEGGITFILCVIKKRKDDREWSEVFIDTGYGVIKGAVRGAGVYALTSFTVTSAPVATALFTAIFDIAEQSRLYCSAEIAADVFAVNANQIALDVSVSAGFSCLGQVLIPVPILGALIGNAVGMFSYGLLKGHVADVEGHNIKQRQDMLEALDREIEQAHSLCLLTLEASSMHFSALMESTNTPEGIIKLAEYAGVPREELVLNEADARKVFVA